MDVLPATPASYIRRWRSFGPYFAAFPYPFAETVIANHAPAGGGVLDPFCGRGTTPFAALAGGRFALAIDSNPVAWVFSSVKTAPQPDTTKLHQRLDELCASVTAEDREPENEFQEWCWSKPILGFLNAARRQLDWRADVTDRTLAGFILVHLHAKAGRGISNQMQQSSAQAPDYAIKWWRQREMRPPDIDPGQYFRDRIAWRYAHGVPPRNAKTCVVMGDSADVLSSSSPGGAEAYDLLLTSPPYYNVTNYSQNNWIRLWFLNEGPPVPDWKRDTRTTCRDKYAAMLAAVFTRAKAHLADGATVWVRTDSREFTWESTGAVLRALWPDRTLYQRHAAAARGRAIYLGNGAPELGEVDYLLVPGNRTGHCPLDGWSPA